MCCFAREIYKYFKIYKKSLHKYLPLNPCQARLGKVQGKITAHSDHLKCEPLKCVNEGYFFKVDIKQIKEDEC